MVTNGGGGRGAIGPDKCVRYSRAGEYNKNSRSSAVLYNMNR